MNRIFKLHPVHPVHLVNPVEYSSTTILASPNQTRDEMCKHS